MDFAIIQTLIHSAFYQEQSELLAAASGLILCVSILVGLNFLVSLLRR